MTEQELRARTRQFGLRVMKLIDAIPQNVQGRVIPGRLLRSGSSIGANYHAACRARSKAKCISRLGTAEEEADESGFCLELIIDGGLPDAKRARRLPIAAAELAATAASSRKTAASAFAKSQIANRQSQIF